MVEILVPALLFSGFFLFKRSHKSLQFGTGFLGPAFFCLGLFDFLDCLFYLRPGTLDYALGLFPGFVENFFFLLLNGFEFGSVTFGEILQSFVGSLYLLQLGVFAPKRLLGVNENLWFFMSGCP